MLKATNIYKAFDEALFNVFDSKLSGAKWSPSLGGRVLAKAHCYAA